MVRVCILWTLSRHSAVSCCFVTSVCITLVFEAVRCRTQSLLHCFVHSLSKEQTCNLVYMHGMQQDTKYLCLRTIEISGVLWLAASHT